MEGSVAKILVDATAHLQGSCGDHALTDQGCFGNKGAINTISGR